MGALEDMLMKELSYSLVDRMFSSACRTCCYIVVLNSSLYLFLVGSIFIISFESFINYLSSFYSSVNFTIAINVRKSRCTRKRAHNFIE